MLFVSIFAFFNLSHDFLPQIQGETKTVFAKTNWMEQFLSFLMSERIPDLLVPDLLWIELGTFSFFTNG